MPLSEEIAGREALRDELGLLERIEALLAEPAAQEAIRDRIRAELPTLARFFQADAYLLARLVAAAQVRSWDPRQAVSVIELAIGKDLQYIRVNGTLVGGLLGLAIYGATRLALG
jgi:uncharacterized membrane-anchored protein YjiN (DUF445 family)